MWFVLTSTSPRLSSSSPVGELSAALSLSLALSLSILHHRKWPHSWISARFLHVRFSSTKQQGFCDHLPVSRWEGGARHWPAADRWVRANYRRSKMWTNTRTSARGWSPIRLHRSHCTLPVTVGRRLQGPEKGEEKGLFRKKDPLVKKRFNEGRSNNEAVPRKVYCISLLFMYTNYE